MQQEPEKDNGWRISLLILVLGGGVTIFFCVILNSQWPMAPGVLITGSVLYLWLEQ